MGVDPNLFEPIFEDVFESFFVPCNIGFKVPISSGNSCFYALRMGTFESRQLMDMIFVIKVLGYLNVFV